MKKILVLILMILNVVVFAYACSDNDDGFTRKTVYTQEKLNLVGNVTNPLEFRVLQAPKESSASTDRIVGHKADNEKEGVHIVMQWNILGSKVKLDVRFDLHFDKLYRCFRRYSPFGLLL